MRGLIVLFSDAGGWTSVADDTAAALTRDGALVVGVDLPDYLARLDAHSGEACHDVVGDVEFDQSTDSARAWQHRISNANRRRHRRRWRAGAGHSRTRACGDHCRRG